MDVAAVIAEVDRLQLSNKWREAYDYIKPYADAATDPELMWRIIRAYYRVGKHLARDKQEKDEVAKKASEVSERAIKINQNSFDVQKVLSCDTSRCDCLIILSSGFSGVVFC